MTLDDATEADLPAIHALNQSEVPAVSDIDFATLEWFFARAAGLRVARVDDAVAAFMLGLPPGLAYASQNYRWFSAHYDDFYYIDRLVVGADWRRRGIARALYADADARAAAGERPRLACEVNERPRNDVSLAFHAALGFEPVGRQDTEGGSKAVVMLTRAVPHRAHA